MYEPMPTQLGLGIALGLQTRLAYSGGRRSVTLHRHNCPTGALSLWAHPAVPNFPRSGTAKQ